MTLKEWKITQNIHSFRELAEKLGVNSSRNPARLVQRWVQGDSIPREKHLKIIMRVTDGKVTPNDFIS